MAKAISITNILIETTGKDLIEFRGALVEIKRKPEKKKRKLLGENDEESEEFGTQTPKNEPKNENIGRKVHKVDFTVNQTS